METTSLSRRTYVYNTEIGHNAFLNNKKMMGKKQIKEVKNPKPRATFDSKIFNH
jgi:hypothetical protein